MNTDYNNDDQSYLDEYRQYLISSKQQSQDLSDKYLISLSSAAIGISIVFITDIIKDKVIYCQILLFLSWLFFVITILLVLLSFYSSVLSFNKAIYQLDNDKIYDESVGGIWNLFTSSLNIISIISFITGLILILIFISHNL